MNALHPFHFTPTDFFMSVIIKGSSVKFDFTGPLHILEILEPKTLPERRKGIWEETCFELFVGEVGSKAYFEINLSPSGDWDVFHFDDYREGMKRVETIAALPFQCKHFGNHLTLECTLPLEAVGLRGKIEIGAAAVLLFRGGSHQYWAVQHTGAQPDFHLRNSFVLNGLNI